MSKKFYALLMSIVICWGNVFIANAQKTVYYSFKGSILNRSNGISLKASGDVPAGVSVGTSKACISNNSDHAYNGTTQDIAHWDMKLFGGYTTLFVTHYNSASDVYFHNFKYQIENVKWKRRSQLRATTSRGYTYITRGDGKDFGFHEYEEDTDDEDYKTLGELFYHNRQFITQEDESGNKLYPFDGLNALHIQVTSRIPLHAIAVKEFQIDYYNPEPIVSISGDDPYELPNNEERVVTIKLTKAKHMGMFRAEDIRLVSTSNLIIVGDVISRIDDCGHDNADDDVVTFTCKINTAASGYGTTSIKAQVMNDGEVAGEAEVPIVVGTTIKWQWANYGPMFNDFGEDDSNDWWDQNDAYCYYRTEPKTKTVNTGFMQWEQQIVENIGYCGIRTTNTDVMSVLGKALDYDIYKNTLSTSSDYEINDQTYGGDNSVYKSIGAMQCPEQTRPRVGIQKAYYSQYIPAYSKINVQMTLKTQYIVTNSDNFAFYYNPEVGAEIVDMGTTDNWPFLNGETGKSDMLSDKEFSVGTDATKLCDNTVCPSDARILSNVAQAHSNRDTEYTNECSYANENTDKNGNKSGFNYDFENTSSAANLTATKKKHFFALKAYGRYNGLNYTRTSYAQTADFYFKDRSEQYTYYAYITYNYNGGAATKEVKNSELNQTLSTRNVSVLADADVTTKLPAPENISRNGYEFIGWVTAANKDTKLNSDGTLKDWATVDYADQGKFNTYNAAKGCGVGPVTLYAVWKKLPVAGEKHIVTYVADGGKVGGTAYVQDMEVENGKAVETIPAATKLDYTFTGYWDDQEETNAVQFSSYSTTGTTLISQTDGNKYVDASGNWALTDDVTFYARFDASSSQKNTYTITLYSNKTSTDTESSTLTVTEGGEANNAIDVSPTYDGYEITGWYTERTSGEMVYNADGQAIELDLDNTTGIDEDGKTVSYLSDDAIEYNIAYKAINSNYWNNDGTWKGTGDLTLYAHWKEAGLISFYENDADGGHNSLYNDGELIPNTRRKQDYQKIDIHRTLKANDIWNTVCLPFSLNNAQMNSLFSTVMKFCGIKLLNNGETASLQFENVTKMEAGVPYFVKLNSEASETANLRVTYSDTEKTSVNNIRFEYNGDKIEDNQVTMAATPTDLSYSKDGVTVTMKGSYESITMDPGTYYLQNNKFYISGKYYVIDNKTVKVKGKNRGYRVTFTVESPSQESKPINLGLNLEGFDDYDPISTGIETLDNNVQEDKMYDLFGRRLTSKPVNGVYIFNGKKYVVK